MICRTSLCVFSTYFEPDAGEDVVQKRHPIIQLSATNRMPCQSCLDANKFGQVRKLCRLPGTVSGCSSARYTRSPPLHDLAIRKPKRIQHARILPELWAADRISSYKHIPLNDPAFPLSIGAVRRYIRL